MAITHQYTLVCDDVRQENTGKFIIVGLYTSTMGIPQIPFVLPFLTFFMFVNADRPEQASFRMRLERMENGQRLVEGMGMIAVQRPGIGASPMRVGPIQFQATGMYSFVVDIEGLRDPIITSFEVILAPPQVPQQQLRQG